MTDLLTGQAVAEVKLLYTSKVPQSEMRKINSSRDACELLRTIPHLAENIEHKEYFYVMFLNRANKVKAVNLVSEGGISGTIVDPRIILQGAILTNSSAIILMHNHPSGSTQPSEADRKLTDKIKEAAKYHEISVLDHLIVTSESYLSFADEGLM